jgi:hypothetical protein
MEQRDEIALLLRSPGASDPGLTGLFQTYAAVVLLRQFPISKQSE